MSSRVAAFDNLAESYDSMAVTPQKPSAAKWAPVNVRFVRTPPLQTASVCISSSNRSDEAGSPMSPEVRVIQAGPAPRGMHAKAPESSPGGELSGSAALTVSSGVSRAERSMSVDGHHDGNGFTSGHSPLSAIRNSFSESRVTYEQQQRLLGMYKGTESMLPGVPRAAIEQGLIDASDLPEGFLSKAATLRERRQSYQNQLVPRSLPATRSGTLL
jgi:hypothetical protein